MFRIVLILSVLTLFALPALNVEAAASMLERPTFTCRSDGASVRFSWRPASDASQEYLDLSLQDNGFAPGTYVSAGPLDGAASSYTWNGVRTNVRHYYRLNTLTVDGWQAASDTFTAPCRPREAWAGGRDVPFDLNPGLYTLDLASGAIRRLQDMRNAVPLYGQPSTYAWSPDGTKVASIKDAESSVSLYDAATGHLLRELPGRGYSVHWLKDGTITVPSLRLSEPDGEQGLGRIDQDSAAILSFEPSQRDYVVSPDGRSAAVARSASYSSGVQSGLYVRVAGDDERLLTASLVQRPGPVCPPDSTRLALG